MPAITRRRASALIAAASTLISTALNAGPGLDPVYSALAAYDAAHKAEAKASARLAALEDKHPGAFRVPQVPLMFPAIAKQPAFAQASTAAEVDRFFDAWERASAAGALEPHRVRTHAELQAALDAFEAHRQAIGAEVAELPLQDAEDRLMDAEAAALSTQPTTQAGAAALAAFAARIRKGEQAPCRRDDDKYLTAFQALSAFLSQAT